MMKDNAQYLVQMTVSQGLVRQGLDFAMTEGDFPKRLGIPLQVEQIEAEQEDLGIRKLFERELKKASGPAKPMGADHHHAHHRHDFHDDRGGILFVEESW